MRISKTIKLFHLNAKMSIQVYLEYRTSLIFYALSGILWAFASVFILKLIFNQIQTLKGWTFGEIVLLNAVYNFAFAFFIMFSNSSLWRFKEIVRHGTLDQVLVKPYKHLLHLRFDDFDISGVIHLLPSIALLILALQNCTLNLSIPRILLFIFLFCIGQYALNSFLYLLYASTFWLTSAEHIPFWSFESQSKTPLEILPNFVRVLFLSLIPVGFVAYIPTKVLLGNISPGIIIYSCIFTIIITIINRLVWIKGLQRYESTSS